MTCKLLKGLAIALTIASTGTSHGFPDKPVTILVPFAAGSSTDVAARTLGEGLSRTLNQGVNVDNRTGAEGQIAARAILSGPTDGHLLLFTSSSLTVLDPLMKSNLPYDPTTDFATICAVTGVPFLLYITGSSQLKAVGEVVAAAKAAPGKLTFAFSSASTRLAGELFQQVAGVKLTGIPYRSSVAGLTEVAAGQVDIFFIDPVSAGPFSQSGKLRPLVVAGATRAKEHPETPSSSEVGLADFKVTPWHGIYMSAKVPTIVAEQVRAAVEKTVNRPEIKAAFEKRNLTPLGICGESMKVFQKEEVELWRRVTKKAGIEPQ